MRAVLRVREIVAVAAGLLLSLACDKGQAEVSPPGSSGGSSVAASRGGGEGAGGAGSSGPGAPATGAEPVRCEPTIEAEPTGFFGMRMILRLPQDVELVEQNPFFARAPNGSQVARCGPPLTFAGVGFMRSGSALKDVRRTVLRMRGLPPEAISGFEGEQDQGSTHSATYVAPTGPNGEPAAKGFIFLRRDREWVYWIVFEGRPEDYASLDPVFRASALSLLVQGAR